MGRFSINARVKHLRPRQTSLKPCLTVSFGNWERQREWNWTGDRDNAKHGDQAAVEFGVKGSVFGPKCLQSTFRPPRARCPPWSLKTPILKILDGSRFEEN